MHVAQKSRKVTTNPGFLSLQLLFVYILLQIWGTSYPKINHLSDKRVCWCSRGDHLFPKGQTEPPPTTQPSNKTDSFFLYELSLAWTMRQCDLWNPALFLFRPSQQLSVDDSKAAVFPVCTLDSSPQTGSCAEVWRNGSYSVECGTLLLWLTQQPTPIWRVCACVVHQTSD